jgi:hypothetical protein
MTWTKGIKATPTQPTHWAMYLATSTWASSPAVGMPLSITCPGTGAEREFGTECTPTCRARGARPCFLTQRFEFLGQS